MFNKIVCKQLPWNINRTKMIRLFSDQNCNFRANNKDLYGLQWGWKMENISTCLTYSPIRYFLPSYECFDPKSVVLYALLQPAYRISHCSRIIKINSTKQLSQRLKSTFTKISISRVVPSYQNCSKHFAKINEAGPKGAALCTQKSTRIG